MNYKIVTDSGANLTDLPGVAFENVPITIMADKKEYRDDRFLDGIFRTCRNYDRLFS